MRPHDLTPRQLELVEAFKRLGSISAAAEAMGCERNTVRKAMRKAGIDEVTQAGLSSPRAFNALGTSPHVDPGIQAAMDAANTRLVPAAAWVKTKGDDDTPGYSVLLRPEGQTRADLMEMIRETTREVMAAHKPSLPPAFTAQDGHLVVVDPADVHIGKLCVKSETGYHYDESVAAHRLIEGSRGICEKGMKNGATHALFVLGNDIAHIDNAKKTTTSGTPQDVSTSIFGIYRAAKIGYAQAIRNALDMGLSVQLLFCPSNHDWVLGYTLADTLGSLFRHHPNVIASDYALSERHRKYVQFGHNLLGFTHGDGAKESALLPLMIQETGQAARDCPLRYWYLHHYHHKIRKAEGIRPMERERDHIGMTVIKSGAGQMEGDNVQIEYARSPSPPDGWHDRNGFVNRQAVEAFVHDAQDGQIHRFTQWF